MNIWKTADGREIPFEKLTDDHLANCINLLENRLLRTGATLGLLREEQAKREGKVSDNYYDYWLKETIGEDCYGYGY